MYIFTATVILQKIYGKLNSPVTVEFLQTRFVSTNKEISNILQKYLLWNDTKEERFFHIFFKFNDSICILFL